MILNTSSAGRRTAGRAALGSTAILAVGLVSAASIVLALVGPTDSPAAAAELTAWGTFSTSGSARAYTGTLTLPGGFPATTFTSTSREATLPTGASVWQAASTPAGAVYGSSRGKQYLNQRPRADNPSSPAVTTYSFATPTPASGWSFVLGDIDADQATVSATAPDGSAVPIAGLGFDGVYNYCHRAGGPSCDSANTGDVPSWDGATGILKGNAAATDTEGAAGWFSPNTALSSLTITYQQRSGFPVYQTWFAAKTFAPSGRVTVDGTPAADVALTVQDAAGAVVGTTTTTAAGTWSLPGLVAAGGYTVTAATPAGASTLAPIAFDTLDTDTPNLDFAFSAPTVSVTGVVESPAGDPLPSADVVFTPTAPDLPPTTVATDAAGGFTADLFPSEPYTAVVDGAVDQPIRFTAPSTSGPLGVALVQPAAPAPTPTPTATPTPLTPPAGTPPAGSPPPTPGVTATARSAAPELASTGSSPSVPLGVGILLLLGGSALAVRTGLRHRRR